jgi:hypothetical protein
MGKVFIDDRCCDGPSNVARICLSLATVNTGWTCVEAMMSADPLWCSLLKRLAALWFAVALVAAAALAGPA